MENEAIGGFKPEKIIEDAKKHLGEMESLVDSLDETVKRLVSERPMMLLAGTLLAGYVAGRVLTRARG